MEVNIVTILSITMIVIYNINVFEFATIILDQPIKNRILFSIISTINISCFATALFFEVPTSIILLAIYFVLALEFKLLSKATLRQVSFGASIFLYHIILVSSITLYTVYYIFKIPMSELFSHQDVLFGSLAIEFFALAIILNVFQSKVKLPTVKKLSKTRKYSELITITSIILMIYVILDLVLLQIDIVSLDTIFIVYSSAFFVTLIFYIIFLYALTLVKLHVFKKVSDESENSFVNTINTSKRKIRLNRFDSNELYSRKYIEDIIGAISKKEKYNIGLFYVELMSLQYVNDTFGAVIVERYENIIESAIKDTIRDTDFLAKINRGEFFVILENVNEFDINIIKKRLKRNIAKYNEKEFFLVGAYVGAFTIDENSEKMSSKELIRKVELIKQKEKDDFNFRLDGKV